jgi:hypothetical protein
MGTRDTGLRKLVCKTIVLSGLFDRTINARRATAAQWLRLRLELRNLAVLFADKGADFVLLKGAVLAFLAYPDCSLRPVSGQRIEASGGMFL